MPKFRVKSHEREPEEPERGGLQCNACTEIAEHTPEEYRLEKDSPERSEKPKPLLPLSDD